MREGEALKDWLQNWYIIRENGLVLFGPPPKEVIPPITQDEFIKAVRRYATEVIERATNEQDRKDQSYTILILCRALHILRTGKQTSKIQAAFWAQKELPQWSNLIQNALIWRQVWRNGHVNHIVNRAETVQFVKFVSEQLEP
jgi:hypothetical protein